MDLLQTGTLALCSSVTLIRPISSTSATPSSPSFCTIPNISQDIKETTKKHPVYHRLSRYSVAPIISK